LEEVVMSSVAVLPREETLAAPSFEPILDTVDGLVVEKRMGTKSGLTGNQINWRLSGHVHANGLGTVLPSEVAFQFAGLAGGRPRFADVAFVAKGRYAGGEVPDGWADFAPDFVVEVVSPHDNATSLDLKVQEWLACGVRLVWVVYPATKHVIVRRADGTSADVPMNGTLSGEDIVPGFMLLVSDIFVVI
jgi:Uma2 family endonuclease